MTLHRAAAFWVGILAVTLCGSNAFAQLPQLGTAVPDRLASDTTLVRPLQLAGIHGLLKARYSVGKLCRISWTAGEQYPIVDSTVSQSAVDSILDLLRSEYGRERAFGTAYTERCPPCVTTSASWESDLVQIRFLYEPFYIDMVIAKSGWLYEFQ